MNVMLFDQHDVSRIGAPLPSGGPETDCLVEERNPFPVGSQAGRDFIFML